MKNLNYLFLILFLLTIGVVGTSAQTTIQSNGTGGGAWDATTTWNGSVVPGDVDSVVILTGDSVWLPVSDTCGGLTILPGANVATYAKLVPANITLAGTLTAYADTVFQGDMMVVNNGGIYNHAMNGGRIPTATWEPGSLFLVTGLVGNTPSNGSQNFYNVTWNCPNQASNLNLGWDSITIGGDVTMLRSGTYPTFVRWNMTAPLANDSSTVTIMGDVIVRRGALSSNGTSNANTKITIHHYGNIIVDGEDPSRDSCNFSISRGSQGNGSGSSTWYVYGDFLMNNATSQNSNPTNARFSFVKQGAQTLSINPNCNLIAFPVRVGAGTTLDMGASMVYGNGTVVIDSGATIELLNTGGMDSTFAGTGTKTLSIASNYIFNGSSAGVTGRLMPDTVNAVTINNTAGVTLSDSISVAGALTLTGGDLNLGDKLVTLLPSATLNEPAGNTAIGMLTTTRDVAQGVDETFGGIGLTVNAAGAAPGFTTVLRTTGVAQTYFAHESILRSFDISPTVNSGLNAQLDYFYDDSELNGQVASTLELWKSEDNGATWDKVPSVLNTGLRRLRATGVESFSRFTAADSANAMNVGSFLYSVNGGWNMVSLPLDVEDAQKTSVFPTASTNAFKYDGAYVIADVLEVGAGYWLKFSSVQDVQITGATIKDNTVDLVAGWNMIGGISDAIATTAILQTPPGIVESPYFGYNAGYVPADSLIPSRAYWVKAGTGGGQITLSSEVLHKSGISELERLQGFNTITLCDKNGASQTLYVGKAPEDGLDLQRYELPPSPPTGLFDARFTSGRFVEVYPQQPAETKNIPITVSSAAYPITVSWEIADEEKAFAVSCITEKSMIKQPMKGAGNIVIQQPASRIAITVSDGSSAPKQFALGECYPNPFNPTTLIRYSLPVKSIVTLNVFNLLGQEITTLLDGQEVDKGEYEISFNAASLPSGVYIYRINAVGQDGILSYTDTKRMVLMK